MKIGWQTKKLGEICSFLNRGISPRYLEEGGICVLNQKCVRNHQVSFEPSRRHDAKGKKVESERVLQAGDVLVNSTGTGTLGRVAQMRESPSELTTVDLHITIVRPIPGKFYSEFFGYMLEVIEDAIKESGVGVGGQTELARTALAEKFMVHYPELLVEQQKIVDLLDKAFAGIDVVKASADKNLQNAQALFESHLHSVFSLQGKSWIETTVAKISTNLDNRRVPITKNVRTSGNYPYYGASGIVDYVGDYIFEGDTLLVSEDGANLLARATPIAFSVSGKYWVNNHAHILKFKNMATQRFVEFYLESIKLDEFITGAAQPKLNQKALNSIPIPIPELIDAQAKIVEGIKSLQTETQRLETIYKQKLEAVGALRKSLLHEAFAGNL